MNKNTNFPKLPPVWLYGFISAIRNFLIKLYTKLVPANVAVFEKAQGFFIAKTLGVACELNLADIIGSKSMPVEEIASRSGTDPGALYRFMRALAGEGIFKETNKKVFKNTGMSRALMDGKGSLKYMIQHQLNKTNWALMNELDYSIRTGKNAARELLGTDIFTHLSKSPEKNLLYNKAMTNTSDVSSASIIAAYNFSGIKSIVDLGGGEGYLLSAILSRHPKMKGLVMDLPHVVEPAQKIFKKFGVENRATVIPGNFFEVVPEGSDAYMMKNILHAYNDDSCIKLLQKIKDAMVDDGKVLIVDTVIQEDNKPAFGKIFDLQMLLGLDGGKERTRVEFDEILEQAGFRLKRVIKTISPFSIVEGIVK